MNEFFETIQREFEKFQEAIGAETDPVMLVLRAHLYSENLLERLILAHLSRGDKLLENGSLTYHQKLVLVEAVEGLPDSITSSLRRLNKLRNQCAHELGKKIVEIDITKMGSPLGKTFTEFKKKAEFDDARLLRLVITHVCSFISGVCFSLEHPDAKGPDTAFAEHLGQDGLPKGCSGGP